MVGNKGRQVPRRWSRQTRLSIQSSFSFSHQNAYDESSESDEDDYVDDHVFAEHKKQSLLKTGYRISVSAEAYGAFNKKEDYVPKVIAKSEDQVNRLKSRMEQSFMFAALEDKEQKIVIDAFEEKIFK